MKIRLAGSQLREERKAIWAESQANAIERKLADGQYDGNMAIEMQKLARKYRKQVDAYQRMIFI